eukprot:4522512-Prorocentrum_lima.AAC.1
MIVLPGVGGPMLGSLPKCCSNQACSVMEGVHRKCGGCRDVRYCAAECQRADWEEHKKWCNKYREARKSLSTMHGDVTDSWSGVNLAGLVIRMGGEVHFKFKGEMFKVF